MGRATTLVVVRRVAIALTFVIVLLRPGFGTADVPTRLSDIDVLVVVDRTRSMAALDYAGRKPRIEGVRADLTALAEELPGARFAMVGFGAESRLTLPFTTDASAFQSAVETLDLERPREGDGSSATRPVAEVVEVLERAAERRPDRRRVVVYVGDGEDTTSAGADRSFDEVADLVVGGAVLGYGTTDGAEMPAADDLDLDLGYVEDPESGEPAISRADLDNLRDIADELDVDFQHRTGTGDMDRVVDSFEGSYVDGERGDGPPAEHDLTWLFGLLLLGLVLVELRSGWRAVWRSQDALLARTGKGAGR
ncbi:MAG TPA: VWA domain-containing protein [Nocardioides sp.]|nr:VWA domain-containing protein [Nocardioides sp.]